MKNIFILFLLAFGLLGCATEAIMLKNEANGQIVRCGGSAAGSLAGGLIGYNIEKSNDEKCIKDYEINGFKRIK